LGLKKDQDVNLEAWDQLFVFRGFSSTPRNYIEWVRPKT